MKSSNLNGYYTDGPRIALVRSYCEGINVLYFDNPKITRMSHEAAGMFTPVSLSLALATGLNETNAYVRQVSHCEFIARLSKEPLLALILVDPYYLKPGMSMKKLKRESSLWLKTVHAYFDHPNEIGLTFHVKFSYEDENEEEAILEPAYPSVLIPRTLFESFTEKAYRKWLKETVAKKRANLTEHVKEAMAAITGMGDV